MANIYEEAGREKKAAALLDALDRGQWTGLVHDMTAEHWGSVAREAGVKPPSEETIALVKDRLRRRQMGVV